MVGVDDNSLRRTHRPSRLAWSESVTAAGRWLHSSNEPCELSQWRHHKHTSCSSHYYYYLTITMTDTFNAALF